MPDDALTPDAPAPTIGGDHPLRMADLQVFEDLGAGHALSKHVHNKNGKYKSDAERLSKEPWIPASGGFTNPEMAQRCVDLVVSANFRRIQAWAKSATRENPFIAELALAFSNGTNLSRELFDRGQLHSDPTSGVRVVLFGDRRFESGFAVHTAYNVAVPAQPTRSFRLGEIGAPGVNWPGFLSRAVRERAILDALHYWSAEIDAWRHQPDGATLTRTYCATESIATVPSTPRKRAGGQTWATATPLITVMLERDTASAVGFRLAKVFPSAGF